MNFKREDFQKIYGDAPADFHLRMCKTLDELEETNMNSAISHLPCWRPRQFWR